MTESLADAARRGLDAIALLSEERDSLLQERDRLSVDYSLLSQRLENTERQLATVSCERDHYLRYCTEIVAQLHNLQVLIGETVTRARDSAYRPSSVPLPKHEETEDMAFLRRLASSLAPVPYGEGTDQ